MKAKKYRVIFKKYTGNIFWNINLTLNVLQNPDRECNSSEIAQMDIRLHMDKRKFKYEVKKYKPTDTIDQNNGTENSVAGKRWRRSHQRWAYYGTDAHEIPSFQCFKKPIRMRDWFFI